MDLYRGDIVIVDFEPVTGSEQGGIRPALVLQNNIYNKYSPTTIVAPLTTKKYKKHYPVNVALHKQECNLRQDSTVLLNQIKTIDKQRIKGRISQITPTVQVQVDAAIKASLCLD